MTEILATNIVASRPPKRRPTGTLTAQANFQILETVWNNKNSKESLWNNRNSMEEQKQYEIIETAWNNRNNIEQQKQNGIIGAVWNNRNSMEYQKQYRRLETV